MKKEQYLRDKNYALIYWHSSSGMELSQLHGFINDDGVSLVISARANGLTFNNNAYKCKNINIKPAGGPGGLISKHSDRLDVYFWLISSPVCEVKKLLRDNPQERKKIQNIYKCYKEEINYFNTALFLCEVKAENLSELDKLFNSYHPSQCVKIKTGGVEVVYEYLLSNFIQENEDIILGKPVFIFDEEERKLVDLMPDYPSSTRFTDVYFSPVFTFKTNVDLLHLTKNIINEYEDDYSRWTTEGGAYPYYRLNIESLERIRNQYLIPPRVLAILTEEQKKYLDNNAPNVLDENLVYIFDHIFRYNYAKLVHDASIVNSGEEKSWQLDVYDALGGDGNESVYLGDGLSIDSSGNVVDD